MWKLIATAGLCLTLASLASSRLACYYDSTAETREEPSRLMVSDIDPNKCTHLMFAFCNINDQNELAPNTVDDIPRYLAFNELKNRNPLLKTLLAVGGLTSDAQRFSTVVASQQNRAIFIQSAIKFLRSFRFDGLNLDWRHPNGAESQPQDKHGFTLLCEELKNAFEAEGRASGRDSLIITATVSAERAVIDANYEVEQIAMYLDFINVLTFDLHRPWEGVARHHSPLYQGSHDSGDSIYSNVHAAMQYWHEMGAPPQKLNLGFGAYGKVYNLASESNYVGAPVNGLGDKGCNTCADGMWAYYQTCQYLKEVTASMIPDQQVPYATIDNKWAGFDNKESRDTKITYLQTNEYGGAFVWSLDLDDFSGQYCNEGDFPFISHLHTRLVQDTSGLQILPAAPAVYPNTPLSSNICAGKSNGNYANPDNTNSYYSCVNQSPTLHVCQAGLIFIEQLNYCVRINITADTQKPEVTFNTTNADKTSLSLLNLARSATTIPATTTVNPTNPTNTEGSNFCTGKRDGNYANPSDPSSFYNCFSQSLNLFRCQTDWVFVEQLETCMPATTTAAPTTPSHETNTSPTHSTTPKETVSTPQANILASTTPVTTTESSNFCTGKRDGNYANPSDPSSFYTCVNQSPNLVRCQLGETFMVKLNTCVPATTTAASTTHSHETNTSPTHSTTPKETVSTPQTNILAAQSPLITTESSNFCAGKSDGNYGHPTHAGCYYTCVNQSPTLHMCQAGLIYIEKLDMCGWNNTNLSTLNTTAALTTTRSQETNTPSTTTAPTGSKTTATTPAPATISTTTPTVAEDPDFCLGKSDGNYAHPTHPSCYYTCVNHVPILRLCQAGLIFIEQLNSCVWNNTNVTLLQTTAAVTTLNLSPSTDVTPTEAMSTPQTTTPSNFCIGKVDGDYANPSNPNSYYSCVGQVTHYRPCQFGLVFIELLNRCDSPTVNVTAIMSLSARTASTSSSPNMTTALGDFGDPCAGKIGHFPDPDDPTYFFNCDKVGAHREACPKGTFFTTSCFCCGFL